MANNVWLEKVVGYERTANALIVFNDKLYANSQHVPIDTWGRLVEWSGTEWVEKTSAFVGLRNVLSFAVFNSKLYGVGYNTGSTPFPGHLVEWNGTDAWVSKANKYDGVETLVALTVYNGKLYASSKDSSVLLEWNGTDAWILKVSSSGKVMESLVVYNNKLYGSAQNGKLYEWNDSDAWIEKAPAAEAVYSNLIVHNSKLYGVSNYGKLLEWNDSDAWVEKAPKYSLNDYLSATTVFTGKIYAAGNTGRLLEWNGTDAWVMKAPPTGTRQPGVDEVIRTLCVFDNKLYCVTYKGNLCVWSSLSGPFFTHRRK